MRRMATTKELDYTNDLQKYLWMSDNSLIIKTPSDLNSSIHMSPDFMSFVHNKAFNMQAPELNIHGKEKLSFYGADDEGGEPAYYIDIDEENGVSIGYYDANQDEYLYIFQVLGGNIICQNLPTSDPQVEGTLWNDSGVLKISAGE